MLITPAELARLMGCKPPSVSKAISSGRISSAVVEQNGKKYLDRDLAVELWHKNTKQSPLQPDKIAGKAPRPSLSSREDVKGYVDTLPDDAIPELNVSRERREHYQAELAKLEVDLKRKELVPADAVKKEAFNLAKTVREALINIPDRVSNQFAAESDPQAIHMALTHELQSALERLADA